MGTIFLKIEMHDVYSSSFYPEKNLHLYVQNQFQSLATKNNLLGISLQLLLLQDSPGLPPDPWSIADKDSATAYTMSKISR